MKKWLSVAVFWCWLRCVSFFSPLAIVVVHGRSLRGNLALVNVWRFNGGQESRCGKICNEMAWQR